MRERKTGLLPFGIIIVYIFVLPAISVAQIGALETDIIEYTSLWKGERFLDGRPKVPDEILERMKEVSIEEAWGVLTSHGYRHQFETGWDNMHPDRVIVGRAVTATFMPQRPDVQNETEKRGKEQGRVGGQNSWVIDTLVENDLIVVDMFKTRNFVGDNLANWIATTTGTGMVIHGGNRDIDGIYEIPDFNSYVRFYNPDGMVDVTLMGINIPTRIGQVTVMPGDVVLGGREGVIFIPAHLAQEVVESSELVRIKDEFRQICFREKKYPLEQIYGKWTEEIEKGYMEWVKDQDKKGKLTSYQREQLLK